MCAAHATTDSVIGCDEYASAVVWWRASATNASKNAFIGITSSQRSCGRVVQGGPEPTTWRSSPITSLATSVMTGAAQPSASLPPLICERATLAAADAVIDLVA